MSEDDGDVRHSRIAKTKVFADVNKQIGYMKTDHIRGKIFARRETEESDSDSDDSVKLSPKNNGSSIIRKKVTN
jgi:hypothetical protein